MKMGYGTLAQKAQCAIVLLRQMDMIFMLQKFQ